MRGVAYERIQRALATLLSVPKITGWNTTHEWLPAIWTFDVARNLLAIINRRRAVNIQDLRVKLSAWALREEQRLLASQRKGAQARVDLIQDQVFTIAALCDGLSTIAELKARIASFFSEDTANAVVCSSIHRAKGLEAERVFLLTDTLYLGGFKQTIEEENIHYVGLTRAKYSLFLVFDPERRARREAREKARTK
jgi:DNA helicase-2/ATP-dependent DNA helicase PcrA